MVDRSSSTVHSQKLGKTRSGHDEGYHLDPIYIQSHCIRSVLSSVILKEMLSNKSHGYFVDNNQESSTYMKGLHMFP